MHMYLVFVYKILIEFPFSSGQQKNEHALAIPHSILVYTFLLKTEKAWPQDLHTTLGLPELVGGYVEYPALGANLKGPAPAPNPGWWPLTAPVPITSFSRPQHEAHMDEAPAWHHKTP